MFHLKPKPSPPELVGWETPGQEVGFLRDHGDAREGGVDALVRRLQEADGVAVLVAALRVRQPLARPSRIVEIEHRGDRIDPKPVDVEAVEPVNRVGDQHARDFAPAEIVDRGVPVRVKAAARVGMLVEGRAVEAGEPVLVGWEMGGHPVEDYAEPGLVRAVDEALEALRIAVAAGGGEKPDRLIPPGRIERMLRHGKKLKVGKAHLHRVGDEFAREIVVAQKAVVPLAPPRAEVNLVDRHGAAPCVGGRTPAYMRVVGPDEIVRARNDGGGGRPHLAGKAERIGFEWNEVALRGDNLVFVGGPFDNARREQLPEPAVDAFAHGVAAAVPLIEVADHGDAPGLRRPYREQHALDALMLDGVRAEPFIEALMGSLDEEMVVERAESWAEGVGVEEFPGLALVLGAKAIGEPVRLSWQKGFEKVALAPPFERDEGIARRDHRPQARHARNEGANRHPAADAVQS